MHKLNEVLSKTVMDVHYPINSSLVCGYLLSSLFLFATLYGMQTRSSDENSVRPSFRPSVKRVDCDKTEEQSVQIFI